MRMEQLKYLVDIAETKSMSKTAEHMFVSPQAISKAIKQLENELDTELLVRTSTGVALTKVGAEIVSLAENMLKEEQQMNQIVARSKHRVHEDNSFPIRICSISAIANVVLPDIIARFAYVNINIIPRIYMVDSVEAVFEDLERGLCDLGLVTYNEEALFRKFAPYQDRLDMNFLAQDEQVVVMDYHMYHGQDTLTPTDLHGHFCSVFGIIPVEEYLPGSDMRHVMRSNDADFHRAMIKKAGAYVIMPRLAYQHFFSGKSYIAVPLDAERPPMLHAAVYRKEAPEELRRFAAMIRVELQ